MNRKNVWIGTVAVGATIGALNLGHYAITSLMEGMDRPFAIFPGGLPVAAVLGLMGKSLSPGLVAMIVLGLGIVAGAALSARMSGELTSAKVRAKRLTGSQALRAAAGGVLMGVGVWMAQGCLVRHALSGAPGLALSSWLALAGIVGGIWLAATVEARRV
jgi:uncharacterized membrane protein YedE/YeeE